MGSFSERLAARLRVGKPKAVPPAAERLVKAAITRAGKVHEGRSHYEIRQYLGDPIPQRSDLNDVEGFTTSTGRFVDRNEAQDVAVAAGQIRERMGRKLLSSDLDW